jgi:hypothetical protein
MKEGTPMADDKIQHGIDDNPQNDAEKGAALGGLGGAAVGAIAGAAAGPLGAVIGAVAGGLVGAGASGAAVGALDEVDNDNTVTGLGDDAVATRTSDPAVTDRNTTRNLTNDPTGSTGVDTTVNHIDAATVTPIAGTGSIGGTAVNTGEATGNYQTATNLSTGNTPTMARSGSEYDLASPTSQYEANYGTGSNAELAHDQRNAATGMTSVGGTDMNVDSDTRGDLMGEGTPGVRSDDSNSDSTNHNNDTRGIS